MRRPAKTDSVLVVDPNTVLALAIAFQRLQPVTWWRTQEFQRLSGVQLSQLSRGNPRDRRKLLALACLEQGSRVCATEALDHGGIL